MGRPADIAFEGKALPALRGCSRHCVERDSNLNAL
jgi:hypothetical protein